MPSAKVPNLPRIAGQFTGSEFADKAVQKLGGIHASVRSGAQRVSESGPPHGNIAVLTRFSIANHVVGEIGMMVALFPFPSMHVQRHAAERLTSS